MVFLVTPSPDGFLMVRTELFTKLQSYWPTIKILSHNKLLIITCLTK